MDEEQTRRLLMNKLLVGGSTLVPGATIGLHWGVPGLLVGATAAFAASLIIPEVVAGGTPLPRAVPHSLTPRADGRSRRSLADRLRGIHPDEDATHPADLEEREAGTGQWKYTCPSPLPVSVPPMPALVPRPGSPGQEGALIGEQHPLSIAPTFQPAIESLCGQCVNIVGMRRKGKSVLMRVLAEEIGRYHVPLVFFDTENEYQSLAQHLFLSRGVVVGSPDGARDAYEGVRYHVIAPEDQAGAAAFGRSVLEGNLQVIVDLKSYEDNDAALLMSWVVGAMDEWEQERSFGERIPVFAFLDEAPHWFPQAGDETPLTQKSKAAVNGAFFDIIVRRGGKRGWGLVAAYQKRAEVDNRLLQAPFQFVFGQSEPPDLERCKKLGLDPEEVKALPQGEAFAFCPQQPGALRIRVRMSRSVHLGKTPTMENLAEHQRRALAFPVTGVLARLPGSVTGTPPVSRVPRHEHRTALREQAYRQALGLPTARRERGTGTTLLEDGDGPEAGPAPDLDGSTMARKVPSLPVQLGGRLLAAYEIFQEDERTRRPGEKTLSCYQLAAALSARGYADCKKTTANELLNHLAARGLIVR